MKKITFSYLVIMMLFVVTGVVSAQDLTIGQPTAISGWTSTQGVVSVAPGGTTLPTVSSGSATCLTGYTLRIGSNSAYLEISATRPISRIAFDGTANSSGTYAYVCVIAYSTDGGTTWCSEANALTFTINGYNNPCLNYDNSSLPANINKMRIWRKYVNGGSGVGSGSTLRMGNLKVWAPETCTPATAFNVGGTTTIASGNSTNITLDGSTAGLDYQLYKGGVAEGSTVAGTGSSLSWNVTPSSSSTYTIKTVATATICQTSMTGSAVVTVNQSVPIIELTSAAGTNAQNVTVNNAITNITYSVASGTATTAAVTWTGTADANTPPAGIAVNFVYPTLTISGTPSATGSFGYTVTTDGTPAAEATGTINSSIYTVGDYKAVASANWGLASTWNKWSGSAWAASADFPNATTANVYIVGGLTVNNESSARSIKNLYISENSILTSSNKVNTPVYLKVYGSTVSVESGSRIGNLLEGNDADGISLDVFSTNLTVTGNGGTINLSRIRTNTASTTVVIDNNVTLNYHGSGNAGNAASFYCVNVDNTTLTINEGKTLTFAPWSCYIPNGTSHSTSSAYSQTINVNGTMTFIDGTVPGNATANGWSGHTNNYLSMVSTGGKAFNLNIGSTGTLNVGELYPNGTKADETPGAGEVVGISVAAGGVINVSKVADLRNVTQSISGAGTINLLSGAELRIGNANGINTDNGSVLTTGLNIDAGAKVVYESSVAQITGSRLPATINSLAVKNNVSLSLSSSTEVTGTLTLTTGKLLAGDNNLTVSGAVSGGSAASYVVTAGTGKLIQAAQAATESVFHVGTAVDSYDPVSLTPTDATSIAVKVGTTLPADAPSRYTYNAKVWDITPVAASSTLVKLTPSSAIATQISDVIGHYVGSEYINVKAVKTGSTYEATFTSFSPFVTGTTDIGTGLNNDMVQSMVYLDGNTIRNLNNQHITLMDVSGRQLLNTKSEIDLSNYSQGIYIIKAEKLNLKISLTR